MISRWIRGWLLPLIRPVLARLARLGFTPTAASVSGLLLVAAAGVPASHGRFVVAGALYLLGGVLDAIDGELARIAGRASDAGAFLDSLCDHMGDFAFSLGLVWFYGARGAIDEVLLVFFVLFGAMLGSHVRSRAAMVGIDLKDVGVATRFERMCLLAAGLFAGRVSAALVLLAVLTGTTTFQRTAAALRAARGARNAAPLKARRASPVHA